MGGGFCSFMWTGVLNTCQCNFSYVPWLSFWPQKALFQMKFTDLYKFYTAITMLLWALWAIGPRMQKYDEAGKVWFVWWNSMTCNGNRGISLSMDWWADYKTDMLITKQVYLWDVKTGISQGHVDHIIHITGYRQICERYVPCVLMGETKVQRPEFDSNFCHTRCEAFLHSTNAANEILL
jgi:hypothetical protein